MASPASTAPTADSSAAATLLPGGIEIFSAGTHRDDAGRSHTFTRAQLQEIADSYNAALREAPLTVGHPKDNLPAYGWVARVFVNERGHLAIDPAQVDAQFAEMVKAGRFKKRSASLYPPDAPHNPTPGKWYLRHVAFLGAQPPAVAGLKDIGFAEYGALDEALNFSQPAGEPAPVQPPEEQPMTEQEKAELDKLRADVKALAEAKAAAEAQAASAKEAADAASAQVQSYAEAAAAQRRAGFASFAEAEIKAGRLLPKDKTLAIATLEALATTAAPVSFAEGSTTTQVTAMQMCAWLQGQMSSRTAAVSFGEQAGCGAAAFDARGKDDAEIDAATRRYQAEHPALSYAEAMSHVLSFGA